MILRGRRGSALIQVLVLGGVIAGIIVLLLRFSVARTLNVSKTTHKLAAKAYAEGCMAEFTAAAMLRELHGLPLIGDPNSQVVMGTPHIASCQYPIAGGDMGPPAHISASLLPANYYMGIDGNAYPVPPTIFEITFEVSDAGRLH